MFNENSANNNAINNTELRVLRKISRGTFSANLITFHVD